jgi:hypothetical protein
MTDKELYKYYQYLIRQNIKDAEMSKSLLVKYNELNTAELCDVERNQLRNQYLQLDKETKQNFYREKDAIHQLVCKMKPTHMQTITFCTNRSDKNYSASVCHKTLEVYLKKLNKKLFHRRTDIQLSVMPFQETSASQNIHFHLLLRNPQEHINSKKIDFEEICRSVLRTMKCVDKVNTYNPKTFIKLDYKEERFRNPTFYCLKESVTINDLPLVSDLMFYPH